MRYALKAAVWEVTMACNMRCIHCGSSCPQRPPGELSTGEALDLCRQLAELGLRFITLSGGEPLLRKDWSQIASALTRRNVVVNMITNGWLVDDVVIDRARECNLHNLAVSLDGIEEAHDSIRRKGAYKRVIAALQKMQRRNLPSAVITTVLKRNISQLPAIQKVLEDLGVEYWQLQFGLPMGNLTQDEIINPEQASEIVDFAYSLLDNSPLKPYPADCLGYFTKKSMALRQSVAGRTACWQGCTAGKNSIGILHDGSIVGCTSIRDEQFIEGSIRKHSLRDIWENENAFSWNRDFSRENLRGLCARCRFGDLCLGGCQNVKLSTTGDLGENPYCAYGQSIERLRPKIDRMSDVDRLLDRAKRAVELELLETAEMCLDRAQRVAPENPSVSRLLGQVRYQLRDYQISLGTSRQTQHPASQDE